MKGQSAIEYLTTYGWMLLVIAIVGGAIFTTLQNSSQIKSTSGLANADVKIDEFGITQAGELDVKLIGAASDQVENVNLTISDDEDSKKVYGCSEQTIPVADSETVTVAGVKSSENTNTYAVKIKYDSGGLDGLIEKGSITGRLKLDDSVSCQSITNEETESGSAYFQLNIQDIRNPVIEGNQSNISFDVKNTGEVEDTQQVELYYDKSGDGTAGTVTDTTSIETLSPGSTKNVQLGWQTLEEDVGHTKLSIKTEEEQKTDKIYIEDNLTVESFEWGGSVKEFYTGDTDSFEIIKSEQNASVKKHYLKASTQDQNSYQIKSSPPPEIFPKTGQVFEIWVKPVKFTTGGNRVPLVKWDIKDQSNQLFILASNQTEDGTSKVLPAYNESGYKQQPFSSIEINNNEWNKLRVDWSHSNSGEINLTSYDSQGSVVGTMNFPKSTTFNSESVAFTVESQGGGEIHFDRWRIISK